VSSLRKDYYRLQSDLSPGLMSSTKLGMMDSLIDGEDDQGGIVEAIP
jgi:hypothetical protein